MPLQLEINRFSAEGELLRKIRCLAGRVTVFRSQNQDELEKFKKALEGKPQSERFSILLDNAAYYPDKQIFVGFGPLDEAPPRTTISEYLQTKNVSVDAIEAALILFGLGGLGNASCTELTPNQWKMLRLAGISTMEEPSAVVILQEPFESIPEQYKDVFADRLAKAAWEKNAIIIVTGLSYRPSVWIENDYIARVQLERPRQGTIGFGGGESSAAEAIANIRKEMGVSVPGGTGGVDLLKTPAKPLSKRIIQFLNSPKTLGLVFTLTLILGALLYVMVHDYDPLEKTIASNTVLQKNSVVANAPGNNKVSGDLTQTSQLKQPVVPAVIKKPLLEGYPEDIQVAWTAAIEDPDSFFKNTVQKASATDNAAAQGLPGSPIEALYKELTGAK